MNRIDMSDKFFHGVMFDTEDNYKRLERLRNILRCGYLLSLHEQSKNGLKNYAQDELYYSSNDDKIYLSVYPNGVYSNVYTGKENVRFLYDAFDMTSQTFYFILSSNLKKDYNIRPGNYPKECIILSRIDLYKYLVGIGNPGCNIDYRLITSYYLAKYVNSEINVNELLKSMKVIYPFLDNSDVVLALYSICGSNFDSYCEDYLNHSLESDESELIYYGNYYGIKKILEEENCDIKLYDVSGYNVSADKQLSRVRVMKKYLCNSSCSKGNYFSNMQKLYDEYGIRN